jgi:uncharacterized protein
MYVEQVNTPRFNFLLYLPIPLMFIGVMVLNYFSTKNVDTNAVIKGMVAEYGENMTFVLMILPLSIACLFLLFWVKYIHNQSIRSLTTSRPRIDWSRVLFAFLIWGMLTMVMISISYMKNPADFVFQFNLEDFAMFFVFAIILVPLQTSFEEYLFRGYLMQGLGVVTKTRWFPLIFTSVLFGVMHIANPEVQKLGNIIMIYYIGTGFFLGVLTLLDEGMELALGFHAANNLFAALLITSDWTAFQTNSVLKDISEPTVEMDILLPVFVLFPILLLIFGVKYKWKNSLKRLFIYDKSVEGEEESLWKL